MKNRTTVDLRYSAVVDPSTDDHTAFLAEGTAKLQLFLDVGLRMGVPVTMTLDVGEKVDEKTAVNDSAKGMIRTARGEYIPGYLWTAEDGWYYEEDIQREVSAIIDAVLHANVEIDRETRAQIIQTLTRLKHLPAPILSELICENYRRPLENGITDPKPK